MSDESEKQISTVVKLPEKIHHKGKIDAAKKQKTVAEIYSDIISDYYKVRR